MRFSIAMFDYQRVMQMSRARIPMIGSSDLIFDQNLRDIAGLQNSSAQTLSILEPLCGIIRKDRKETS